MNGFKSSLRTGFLVLVVLVSFCVIAATSQAGSEVVLSVGQQKTVSAKNIQRIAVGNDRIADVQAIEGSEEVLITAIGVGMTNLIIWDSNDDQTSIPITVVALDPVRVADEVRSLLSGVEGITIKTLGSRVVIDGQALRENDLKKINAIAQLYPQVTNLATLSPAVLDTISQQISREFRKAGLSTITAERLGNQIVIDGEVSSEMDKKRAEMIAGSFDVQMINFLEIGVSLKKMIIVHVDFIEMKKGAMQSVGINWGDSLGVNANMDGELGFEGTSDSTPFTGTLGVSASYSATINMLKNNDGARILAQPKLLCRSGEKADFLAGGEVAIPLITADTSTTEYKEYGILLSIEPIIDRSDSISTNILVENSRLVGYVEGRPNFSTSRVNTSINVKSGQLIVLSGLVSNESAKGVDKVPGLGDIPILGELFKSRSFRDAQSELIVFVTPEVVRPGDGKSKKMADEYRQKYDDKADDMKFNIMD